MFCSNTLFCLNIPQHDINVKRAKGLYICIYNCPLNKTPAGLCLTFIKTQVCFGGLPSVSEDCASGRATYKKQPLHELVLLNYSYYSYCCAPPGEQDINHWVFCDSLGVLQPYRRFNLDFCVRMNFSRNGLRYYYNLI